MTWFRVVLCSLFLAGSAQAVELPDFTDLIEQTSPAVVKINTHSNGGPAVSANPRSPEQYRQFFGFDFFGYEQGPQIPQDAVGSGFLISDDGYILTNHHVVDGADEILVRLNDRREFFAELVGSDQQSDLALLKIESDEALPTVDLADPDALEVGDWVLAIGSPFDLDYSASAGIVSAIGRSLPNESGQNYVPFIQTDVAINPGNSGGPLFNLNGEVVGINSQIYTRSGGYMGLSFAIPVGVAKEVVAQLKDTGTVQRGWLGVAIQDVNQDLATSFGLDRPRGALIAQVVEGSPAEGAGLQAGDIILEFNERDIVFSHDLPHVVGLIAPGTEADALVLRDGDERRMEVEVGALPGQAVSSRGNSRSTQPRTGDALGLSLRDLDSDQLRELRVNGGVVIEQVVPESPGARAGLQAGDVIVRLGFEEIASVQEFVRVAQALPRKQLAPVRFWRNGNWFFRTIEVE